MRAMESAMTAPREHTRQPGRVVGLDVARGLLMAWIVFAVHGVFWLHLAPLGPASLALFEMPLIFLISGAAFRLSQRGRPEPGYWGYLLRRGVRILAPYWAFALVCAVLMIALAGKSAFETLLAWLDPVRGGAGYTTLTLSWHLWFVAPFLAVTALMPLVTRVRMPIAAPLWVWAGAATAVAGLADWLDASRFGAGQMVVFYGLWALFGYALAAAPQRYRIAELAVVLALSLIVLIAGVVLFPDLVSPDMQANKFPPNAVFFVFCCAWVAAILIAARFVPEAAVAAMARSPLLRPFIAAGYSIYLWQGAGYAAAILIGRAHGWSAWAMWLLAIAVTIVLGVAAGPLERLRWPLPQRRAAATLS